MLIKNLDKAVELHEDLKKINGNIEQIEKGPQTVSFSSVPTRDPGIIETTKSLFLQSLYAEKQVIERKIGLLD